MGIVLAPLLSLSAEDLLSPTAPVELVGTQGKFDFIKVDALHKRLLACHTGNGSLDVIDLETSKLIKSVPTGAAQGVAVDDKNGRYFVGASKPPQLVIVDSSKLEVAGRVSLPAAADLVVYQPQTDRVFVCNDESPQMWVIDPEEKKIISTFSFQGSGMEDLSFDDKGRFLFQNLKGSNQLLEIDPASGKAVEQWPTAPAESPHGLALLPGQGRALIAGGVGKLSLISLTNGRVLTSTAISPRVDEIAYDAGRQRVYCASGLGVISVVAVNGDQLVSVGEVATFAGAHSIAVDPATHGVWITYFKDGKAFVQKFSPK